MERNSKTALLKSFSLLLVLTLCLAAFASPVSAEASEGKQEEKVKEIKKKILEEAENQGPEPQVVKPVCENGRWRRMHSDMRVFNRNFFLSPEQKEYCITEYEKVATQIRNSSKSDLETYYKLAIWLNKYVDYDWDFWPDGYDLDQYNHQWDAYGILKNKKSICAGIAVAYANVCHAADLPCKFIRMKPYYLDHTINYIPDINGHAFYIDVTENFFFMSSKANPWDPMDTDFACILDNQIPDDGSLEYSNGSLLTPSSIKDYYDTPFDEWYREYALHENTDKKFNTEYVEKGSGDGTYHASYKNYPKQFSSTEKPEIWFLEDFYENPEIIKNKILIHQFDEQLLNISGIKENYDCEDSGQLEAAVAHDMAIKYFPSLENGEVVAKSDRLNYGTDYKVECNSFNKSTGEAKLTIKGNGTYKGEHQITVRIHSAAVTKVPVNKKDLEYTGKPQTLVEPGIAENGTIMYAVVKEGNSQPYPDIFNYAEGYNPNNAPDPGLFSNEIPTATDAGKYIVWYKVEGDANHCDVQPKKLENVAVIAPIESKIIIDLPDEITIKVGETITLEPVLDKEIEGTFKFSTYEDEIVTISSDGVVEGIGVGAADVFIYCKIPDLNPNYKEPDPELITVNVVDGTEEVQKLADAIIEAVNMLGTGTYTSESVQRMKALIEAANGIVDKDDPTQEEIDAAYADLIKGMRTLDPVDKNDKDAALAKTIDQLITELTNIYNQLIEQYDINNKPIHTKASNPMKVKGRKITVSYRKLKKKTQKIKRPKLIVVKNAKGKLKFKIAAAKKGKKSFKKYFKINTRTGKVALRKGLKKGTYKVIVKVKAAGNDKYKASPWKKVLFKVRVK